MIAFVYEPAALRYSPERKNSFPSSFMVASSSGRAGISMAADTMVGPSLLCAPLGTDERHLVNFFSNFPAGGRARVERPRIELNRRAISFVSIFSIDYVLFATCSSQIPSDSFPFEVEPDFCVTGSDLPADHKKSFPHFYRFLRFGDLRAPCAEHYSVPSAHRETPWRPPQQVSRRPRANPHRSRRVRGPRRLGPRFPFFGPLVIFSFAKGRNFCWR